LAEAVGEKRTLPDFVPGVGVDAFVGGGIRTPLNETYVATVGNAREAVKEFNVTGMVPVASPWTIQVPPQLLVLLLPAGHVLAQMAAHPYPADATSWLLKALGFMTQFRLILTPAWLQRCEGAVVQ
jgi:hypothetical protein